MDLSQIISHNWDIKTTQQKRGRDRHNSTPTLPYPTSHTGIPPTFDPMSPAGQLHTSTIPSPAPQNIHANGATAHHPTSRRMAHILSEQKRRENINTGFEELKNVVPSCAHCSDSKAVILKKAVSYIKALQNELAKHTQTPGASTPPSPAGSPPTSYLASPSLSTTAAAKNLVSLASSAMVTDESIKVEDVSPYHHT